MEKLIHTMIATILVLATLTEKTNAQELLDMSKLETYGFCYACGTIALTVFGAVRDPLNRLWRNRKHTLKKQAAAIKRPPPKRPTPAKKNAPQEGPSSEEKS